MNGFVNQIIMLIGCVFALTACKDKQPQNTLHFSTSAEYPPFEYNDHGQIKGFDIELAQIIAQALGKKAVFDNLQFSTVLLAVNSGQDDVAIATLTATDARAKHFDFTDTYYFEGMASVYKTQQPLTKATQLQGKKIAVQMGSVMEIWLNQYPDTSIVAYDNNNQAVKALLAGQVDAVLMDGIQGRIFSKKDTSLSYSIIAKAEQGYALALKKGSPLTAQINQVLKQLKSQGVIAKLEAKWLKDAP